MADTQLQPAGGRAMAELPPGTVTLPPILHGMLDMPAAKQMGLVFSVAAVVALALFIGFWAMSPTMTPLYSSLDGKDAADVSAALLTSGIEYKLDSATGMVMVPKDQVHEARLKMAALGLPKKAAMRGMEQLADDQGFGTSQFIEAARYHNALESELARTISSLRNVRSARVHLALPKQSVFVRDRTPPSASVVVDLIGGEGMNSSNVAAIVHLVSSSVPMLSAQQVTVVDQNGRLLSDASGKSNAMALSGKQYQYTRQIEMDMVGRIETLLTPIIGAGKVRAEVSAEVDFDSIESTSENFDPEKRIVRSEQTSENRRASGNEAAGIPGALSNQPPGDATLTENTAITNGDNATGSDLNSARQAVRNYEVDRTISHTRRGTGAVKRLTVAVLVDHTLQPLIAAAAATTAAAAPAAPAPVSAKLEKRALTAEEIQRLTTLVQEAIGFNEQRGDRVNIISAPFLSDEKIEAIEVPFYEQEWFEPRIKQVVGVLFVLYVIFGVLKPALRNLSSYRPPVIIHAESDDGGHGGLEGEVVRDSEGNVVNPDEMIPLPEDRNQKIEFAQAMVEKDPRRVAKVVKEWVANG